MTFCLAMKVEEGLVGIADTRIISGTEHITARKLTLHEHGNRSMFLMTSGLRSARDKAVTYFNELLESGESQYDKLYNAVNAFGDQVRRVWAEDRETLSESGYPFNLHSIVGGQLEKDKEHKLYHIYPEGNWVEVPRGSPYSIIGESSYGKPLLDRVLRFEMKLYQALKIGYLAFDATRTSATDVDFPIDVVLYQRDSHLICEHRFSREDLKSVSDWWNQRIRESVDQCPSDRLLDALAKLPTQTGGGRAGTGHAQK